MTPRESTNKVYLLYNILLSYYAH